MRTLHRLRQVAFACLLTVAAQASAGAPPLDAYGDLPDIEDGAISPSGKEVAIVGTIKGHRQLVLLDAGMNLLKSVSVGDIKLRGIEWIGEDAVMLTSSRTEALGIGFTTDQFEAYHSTIVPVAPGGKQQTVFGNTRLVVPAIFGRYGIRNINGGWKGYFGAVALERSLVAGAYLKTTNPSLMEFDFKDFSQKRVALPAPELTWRDWLVSADGTVVATMDMNQKSGGWRIAGAGNKTIATGTNAAGNANLISLGRDGTTLIYSAEQGDDEASHWYEAPVDGSRSAAEILKDEEVERVYIDRTNGEMFGYRRGGEHAGRVYFDPRIQALSDKVDRAFKSVDLELIDWTPDFNHVLVRTSGNGDSGTWFLVDLTHLKADSIGTERPAIGREMVGPISTVPYTASDGLQMDGILTVPPGRDPKGLPVVVFPHGGPSAQDDEAFNWWAQAFASRGYAVFQPNFRGSTNRGEGFERAGYGEWGRKMQSDISDGLAELVKRGIVDPKRACIMGASYGGYAALAGVTLQHGLYRCAVAVAPVSDLALMSSTEYRESGTSDVVKHSLEKQLGPRDRLGEVSPRRFAASADAPILLIHGRDDTVVAFEQSTKMADALKDAGKPYKLVELTSEDHWLSRAASRKQMLNEAVSWVEKYNPAN